MDAENLSLSGTQGGIAKPSGADASSWTVYLSSTAVFQKNFFLVLTGCSDGPISGSIDVFDFPVLVKKLPDLVEFNRC
ncbi:hypothetical protein KCU59_g44, partial [Aureobasidium melanogenum]